MSLPRVVSVETLDRLPADDPDAMRSRLDLQRVHRFMGTVSIVASALRTSAVMHRPGPLRILELGAGDGTLLLRVARVLGRVDASVELSMLDRIALIDDETIAGYAKAGWHAHVVTADALQWAVATQPWSIPSRGKRWDLIVATLFMHHFQGSELDLLFRAIGERCDRFFACEPRRSRIALIAGHLTGLIGANAVTREDAVLSVHAGFREHDVGTAWAAVNPGWILDEHDAGLFSHCFDARRPDPS